MISSDAAEIEVEFDHIGASGRVDPHATAVEMSDFALAAFAAGGVRHEIAITGRQQADLERLARDLARVCQWQVDLFGGAPQSRAPFDRYLFQITAVGDGYGGLEHRSSTSLLCRRDELPVRGRAEINDNYLHLLGLASHEYFHSWNVKRIKPAAFTPYDLAREGYTRQLWAFEGITSYYDDLALVRSGVIDDARYLELLGRTLTNVLRTPGRHRQSIGDSSFDAWIKFYRQDENSPNAVVSYYAKGALVALALDLTLRNAGRTSLDDVMRTLWQRYGSTGVGVPESGIEDVVGELAGADMGEFFARYVHGTDDPPLDALLGAFGIDWHLRAASGASDRGGKAAAGTLPACWIGAKIAGRTTTSQIMMFSTTPTSTNTPSSEPMKTRKASSARCSGSAIGTDITCAPITSLSCQPKPLAGPYLATMLAGAASTLLWQRRQAASVMRSGRAT